MADTKNGSGGLASKDAPEEIRREAARLMGSVKSDAKKAASKVWGPINGKAGGRPLVPLESIRCTCAAGNEREGHHWSCPRGQAIKRRSKAGTL